MTQDLHNHDFCGVISKRLDQKYLVSVSEKNCRDICFCMLCDQVSRRRARQNQEAVTAEQRERSARSREEAVARLRRNRDEAQRRQRRAEEGVARLRRQRGEHPGAGAPEQQHQQADQGPARQFNFQEILDLDALNPEYLGM